MSKPVKESVDGNNSTNDVKEDQQPVRDVTISQESAGDVMNGQASTNDETNGETSFDTESLVDDDSSVYDVIEDQDTDSDVTHYHEPVYHATVDEESDDDLGEDPGCDDYPHGSQKEENRKKWLKKKRFLENRRKKR